MNRVVCCPKCEVELTIPVEAGSRRLRCPRCDTRFHPPGAPGGRGAASSIVATEAAPPRTVPQPRPASPPPPLDLRSLDDIRLADDSRDLPPSPSERVADASALFRDDPPARKRPTGAEARARSRRCPTCGRIVPAGMSLCEGCGLDLDTGFRHEVESVEVDQPFPVRADGPPASIWVIGVLGLIGGLGLAGLSFMAYQGVGAICLAVVSLFGAFGAIQLLAGKTARTLMAALLLGGAVDIVALIVLPIARADAHVALKESSGEGVELPPPPAGDVEGEGGADSTGALREHIDMTRVMLGIVLLVMIAVMLAALSTPGVQRYFRRPSVEHDSGFVRI